MFVDHHLLWHYYQEATMLPALAIAFYRLGTQPKNFSEYHIPEKLNVWWEALVPFCPKQNRSKSEAEELKGKPSLEPTWLDSTYRLYVIV